MKIKLKMITQNRKFPNQFPTFSHSMALYAKKEQILRQLKKAATALLLAVSALYPGRESNPYSLNGHRILSPACLPVPPPRQKKKLLVINYWLLD